MNRSPSLAPTIPPVHDPGRLSGEGRAVPAAPVFIVDSDPGSRCRIAGALVSVGLRNPCVELHDAAAAIDELLRSADLGPGHVPALVVLDWHLSGRCGVEVLRSMRQVPALARVPVVLLSGEEDPRSVVLAFELGASSYLVKPLGFDALGGVVRDLGLPWVLA